MFLIVTRNFPPDIGGMQVLMGGLSEGLLNHGPVKVFAYEYPNSENYDKNSSINIERVKGLKLFKKYRKANLVNNFINENSNIRAIIADHWKSLELIKEEYLNRFKTICLLHSKEINHEKGSSLNKRLLKSTDKAKFIIANSNFTKELAIKVGINPSKIHVIFPGINKPKIIENVFKSEAEKIFKDSFPKIITVARLDKRKGHDKILMLIKNLKSKFPKIRYTTDHLYDMEAAGFFKGARNFVGPEKVQCIKIVSDNKDSSILNISSKKIGNWIYSKTSVINKLVNEFLKI